MAGGATEQWQECPIEWLGGHTWRVLLLVLSGWYGGAIAGDVSKGRKRQP
jgi:hypothetical protein